jgi:hypothetical protein
MTGTVPAVTAVACRPSLCRRAGGPGHFRSPSWSRPKVALALCGTSRLTRLGSSPLPRLRSRCCSRVLFSSRTPCQSLSPARSAVTTLTAVTTVVTVTDVSAVAAVTHRSYQALV